MKDSGFVKLNRSILEWEWFQDSSAVHVLVYLLAAVNRLPGRWQGIDIQPGSIVTSRAKISAATGMTEKQVRLALDKLEQCGTITRDGAGKGQLVTLVKWAEYQIEAPRQGRERDRDRAGRGPDEGRERATILEGEKLRREERENSKSPSGDLAQRRDLSKDFEEACAVIWNANPARLIDTERPKFIAYWCEPSRSGRLRFESEKFFDHGRRMDTWMANYRKAEERRPLPSHGLNMARPELNATRRDLKTTWD